MSSLDALWMQSFRPCICGETWPRCARDVNGGAWRSNPGLVTPWRQWCREKLPASTEGLVIAADDGFVRTWTRFEPLGVVKPLEVKTFGARPGVKDRMTLRAIGELHIAAPLIVVLEGNVPGEIAHWPDACPGCGLPERLQIGDWITVNGERVSELELIEILSRHPILEVTP